MDRDGQEIGYTLLGSPDEVKSMNGENMLNVRAKAVGRALRPLCASLLTGRFRAIIQAMTGTCSTPGAKTAVLTGRTAFLGAGPRPEKGFLETSFELVAGRTSREERWGWDGASVESVSAFSHDPIGFAAGDVNLYRYVGNMPTMATDFTGTQAAGANEVLVDQQNPFPVDAKVSGWDIADEIQDFLEGPGEQFDQFGLGLASMWPDVAEWKGGIKWDCDKGTSTLVAKPGAVSGEGLITSGSITAWSTTATAVHDAIYSDTDLNAGQKKVEWEAYCDNPLNNPYTIYHPANVKYNIVWQVTHEKNKTTPCCTTLPGHNGELFEGEQTTMTDELTATLYVSAITPYSVVVFDTEYVKACPCKGDPNKPLF
jgi:hypothetical protein